MSRPRRHRLHSLGQSPRTGTDGARGRYRDSGSGVSACGCTTRAMAVRSVAHEGYMPQSFATAPSRFAPQSDADDWGWPAAEPSALSWPEPVETAQSFSVSFTQPSPIPAAPQPSMIPAPAQPPVNRVPVEVKPTPLADHEAEDDVAAILREKGLQPSQPAAPPVVQPQQPGQATDEDAPEPPVNRHAVFDQLSRTMPHATSFQLGRFNFDRHFDMLEEGMSLGPPPPQPQAPPPASGREIHDLDLLSEIASLSEAAGIPLRREAESDNFMARVAKAQAMGFSSALAEDEDAEMADEEESIDEDFAGTEEAFEEETSSPWREGEEESEEDTSEEENG